MPGKNQSKVVRQHRDPARQFGVKSSSNAFRRNKKRTRQFSACVDMMDMIDACFVLNQHFISVFLLWRSQMFSGVVTHRSGINRYSLLTTLNEPGLAHCECTCCKQDRMALRSVTGASSEVYFQLCC